MKNNILFGLNFVTLMYILYINIYSFNDISSFINQINTLLDPIDTNFLILFSNWYSYSKWITFCYMLCVIILIGLFLKNTGNHVKILNLTSALIFAEYLLSYGYDNFQTIYLTQNFTYFAHLFIYTAIIIAIIFFLSISQKNFFKENTKIEFTLLIWCIIIASTYLISSLDFISIIILIECIAFSSYVLVGFDRKNKFSVTSGLQYLILASIPGGLFILGLVLFYNNFGTFDQTYLNLLLEAFNTNPLNNWEVILATNSIYRSNENYVTFFFRPEFYAENCLTDVISITLYYFDVMEKLLGILSPIVLDTILQTGGFIQGYVYSLPKEQQTAEVVAEIFAQHPEYEASVSLYKIIAEILGKLQPALQVLYSFTTGTVIATNQNLLDIAFKDSLSEYPNIILWIKTLIKFYSTENFSALQHLHGEHVFGNNLRFESELFNVENNDGMFKRSDLLKEVSTSEIYNLITTNKDCFDAFRKGLARFTGDLSNGMEKTIFKSIGGFLNLDPEDPSYLMYIHYLNNLYIKECFSCTPVTYTIALDPLLIEGNNLMSNFDIYNSSEYDIQSSYIYLYLAIIFILANLSFKLTAAPFHFWAPSVYGGSPLVTLTFLSIFSKTIFIFFSIWLFVNIFDSLANIWQILILIIAFLSIFISIIGAFSEKVFKRFFVYSSTGHVGFMLLGLVSLNTNGLKGTVDYVILYILSSFIVWFIIMHLTKKTVTLINLKGLSYNQPYLSLIFSIILFSLSGIPPLGGFFVKYEIFYSLINSSFFFLAYILLLLTIASFFYYIRLIKIFYFENNKNFYKFKDFNDIKLRIISYLFFIIPFFILFSDNAISIFITNILTKSLF